MKRMNSRNKYRPKPVHQQPYSYLEYGDRIYLVAMRDGGILPFTSPSFVEDAQSSLPKIDIEDLIKIRGDWYHQSVGTRIAEISRPHEYATREALPQGVTLEPSSVRDI